MKKLVNSTLLAITLFALTASRALAGDLQEMAGKWSLTRTNDNGSVYTQSLEVTKDKFVFRVMDSDNKIVLYAKGDVKLDKKGEIHSVTFLNIQGGATQDDLQPVDDDRQCVYVLDGNTLTLGLNFDKDREKGPRIEIYSRSKT